MTEGKGWSKQCVMDEISLSKHRNELWADMSFFVDGMLKQLRDRELDNGEAVSWTTASGIKGWQSSRWLVG